MTAPHPPAPTSRTVAAVCAVLAGLLAAVVLVIAAVGVCQWATSPILPAPEPTRFAPIPASTAAPAPYTPAVLTAIPLHQRGPQALEESR